MSTLTSSPRDEDLFAPPPPPPPPPLGRFDSLARGRSGTPDDVVAIVQAEGIRLKAELARQETADRLQREREKHQLEKEHQALLFKRAQDEYDTKKRRDEEIHQATLARLRSPESLGTHTMGLATPTVDAEDDDDLSKLPLAAQATLSQFFGIHPKYLKQIYQKKFHADNLCRLTFTSSFDESEKTRLTYDEDGHSMVSTKLKGKLADYGRDPTIWSEGFLNYSSIEQAFHGNDYPFLNRAHIVFHTDILNLAKSYNWENAVLKLALDFHKQRTFMKTLHDHTAWVVTERIILQYCMGHPKWEPQSNGVSKTNSGGYGSGGNKDGYVKEINDNTVICKAYNKERGCNWPQCRRRHECYTCGKKGHGRTKCTSGSGKQ